MTDILTLSKLPSTSFLLLFRLVFSSLVEIALGMKDATSPADFRMHLRLQKANSDTARLGTVSWFWVVDLRF